MEGAFRKFHCATVVHFNVYPRETVGATCSCASAIHPVSCLWNERRRNSRKAPPRRAPHNDHHLPRSSNMPYSTRPALANSASPLSSSLRIVGERVEFIFLSDFKKLYALTNPFVSYKTGIASPRLLFPLSLLGKLSKRK